MKTRRGESRGPRGRGARCVQFGPRARHRQHQRRPAIGLAGALSVWLALATPLASSGQAEVPAGAPADAEAGRDRNWYFGFGFQREELHLSLDPAAILPESGIEYDAWGSGGTIAVGYRFGPRFRGEVSLGIAGRPARPAGAHALPAVARCTGYVPLVLGRWWEPYLAGGLSGTMAVFGMDEGEDVVYAGSSGDAGAGLLVHLSRRWSLQADYLYAAINVDQEIAERRGSEEEMRPVGHRGRAELFRVSLLFDF